MSTLQRFLWLFVVAALGAVVGCRKEQAEIRVLTDRTESHLAPLFAAYTKATGVAIRVVYVDQGLVARLESRPTEADLVITKDADLLELAKRKGLLRPLGSEAITGAVPAAFRDPAGFYFSDSYRARAIFYSKDRVKAEELSTYEALAEPKWKGRICIRSGYHDYNVSLFAQLMATIGPDRTRALVAGLARNLARAPIGNDRDQARAIHEGKCDVAIMNSYYMGIMLSSPEQKPWGEATRVFFPDQAADGSYVLRSGLALTKSSSNVPAARALLEYMVQQDTQAYIASLTFAYPVVGEAPLPEPNRALGQGQPEVKQGRFKIHAVDLSRIVDQRDTVVRLLDELHFDAPR